jgi:hypothetical protein
MSSNEELSDEELSELIEEAIDWANSDYDKRSRRALKNIISRWPKGVSPSKLVDKSSRFGEGKIGHIAKGKDERLYQLLRQVHHGSPEGMQLDPEGKWRKVGMGLLAAGGIPGVGVYSNMSRTARNVGKGLDELDRLSRPGVGGKAALCLSGYMSYCFDGGKRRATRRGKRSNKTKKSRR